MIGREIAGIPPTGAPVAFRYSVVYDLADGKLTELRAYLPLTATVLQLRTAAEQQVANA